MAKIENAHHQITSSQKENLYYSLKDRELDPWTQSRLDSIETKYNQLKKNFNVLLQLTHTNIHDKSLPIDGDDADNEFVKKKKIFAVIHFLFLLEIFYQI
jgi:seryl-tRNA synthetase